MYEYIPSRNGTRYSETRRARRTRRKRTLRIAARGTPGIYLSAWIYLIGLDLAEEKKGKGEVRWLSTTYQFWTDAVPVHYIPALSDARRCVDDLDWWVF